MGNDILKAAEASGYFWSEPSLGKIGKVPHPSTKHFVGKMYRGSKSIITAEEYRACLKIITAYRKYRAKRNRYY